jgi:hypothetical protein
MKHGVWLSALALAFGACASASLPFKPEPPAPNRSLSADYMLMADRLRVEIDTDGYRLEEAHIVKGDNAIVRAQTVEQPPVGGGSSTGIGFGIGGASYGGRGGVGVGTGVGVSIPVGGGEPRVQGNTVLYFPLNQVGEPPWRLSVKVAQTNPAIIVLPSRR